MARLIEKFVDAAFLQEIARERIKGRILLIGTTNLDTQRPVMWDMGRIAMSDNRDAIGLVRKILPGVGDASRGFSRRSGFRPGCRWRRHQTGLYCSVDIFVGFLRSKVGKTCRLAAIVIRNGKMIPNGNPSTTTSCPLRSVQSPRSSRNQGIGDLYRIYSVTKRDGVDFNLASIPADFSNTGDEPFDQNT